VTGPLILKVGGELLETADQRAKLAAFVAEVSPRRPIVVIHGGGRSIDAELDRRGIAPQKVDGLRVTDEPTLDAVVSVLAGSANTALVAALVGHGVPAVGLTGVDAGFGRAARAHAHRLTSGEVVDLGFVGDPSDVDPSLLELLLVHGYVPVVASLGVSKDFGADTRGSTSGVTPEVLNVNADVMACRVAAALAGSELVIAGTTPGVLDRASQPIPALDLEGIDRLIAEGTASAGMIAKLAACRHALGDGVTSVRIIDGRALDANGDLDAVPGTTLVKAGVGAAPALNRP
jgi:acetylglutamate kinase